MRPSSSELRISSHRLIASISDLASSGSNDFAASMLFACSFSTTGLSSRPRASCNTQDPRSGPRRAMMASTGTRRMSPTVSASAAAAAVVVDVNVAVKMSASSSLPSLPPSPPSLRSGRHSMRRGTVDGWIIVCWFGLFKADPTFASSLFVAMPAELENLQRVLIAPRTLDAILAPTASRRACTSPVVSCTSPKTTLFQEKTCAIPPASIDFEASSSLSTSSDTSM